ncbi:MAG: sigma factor, partial [bacterium]
MINRDGKAGRLEVAVRPPVRLADEEELVARARSGEREPFEELAARYENRLYNYVYRFFGDVETSKDATQEVLLRAYRSLPGFRGDASFGTWLFTIASSVVRNTASYQKVRSRYAIRAMDDEGAERMFNRIPA